MRSPTRLATIAGVLYLLLFGAAFNEGYPYRRSDRSQESAAAASRRAASRRRRWPPSRSNGTGGHVGRPRRKQLAVHRGDAVQYQAGIADTAIDNGYDLSHAGPDGGPLNN
jgi:hypothetical protein